MPFSEQEFSGQEEESFLTEEDKKQKKEITLAERKALFLIEEIEKVYQEMKEQGENLEGWKRIKELTEKIRKIYEGWTKEGKLTKKDILAEYEYKGGCDSVKAANFSPEGDKIIVVAEEGKMLVLSLTEKDETGKPKVLAEYEVGGQVHVVNFSPQGDKVVMREGEGRMGGKMLVLSLTEKDETGKPKVLAEFTYSTNLSSGWVTEANFSPEGDKIVMVTTEGEIVVISLTEKPKILGKSQIYKGAFFPRAANFSPEGDKIIVVTEGGEIMNLFLTEKYKTGGFKFLNKSKINLSSGWVTEANFSPEGDKVMIKSRDEKGGVVVLKMLVLSLTEKDETGNPMILAEYEDVITATDISPEGDKAAFATWDFDKKFAKIIVLSLTEKDETGNPMILAEYEVDDNTSIKSVKFSPKGDKIVIVTNNGKVQVI